MGKSRGEDFDRKFDVWEWHDRKVTREGFKFEVRYRTPENVADKTPKFYIESGNPALYVEDGSISELRHKLDAAIRESFAREWEKRLVVKYQKASLSGHAELYIDVTVYEVSEGEEASSVYRQVYDPDFHEEGEGTGRSHSWSFGQITVVPEDSEGGIEGAIAREARKYGEDDAQIVVLHDTPTNRTGLVRMIEATQVLGSRLAELLNSGEIEKTLSKVTSGHLALPAVAKGR